MTDKAKPPVADIFDQAMKNYEQALKTGVKLQEETNKFLTGLMNQTGSVQDWQKKLTGLTNEFIPATQKRMEECRELIEQNSRASVELLKKATQAAGASAMAESQAKWTEFWEQSLGLVRSNAQAITQMNNRAIDSWLELGRKCSEAAVPKVAKAA